MAISITHTFVSAVPDEGRPDEVGPDEWNAAHTLTGFGTGVETFLETPSSANLATAVTDETGSGALVFATSPTFTTSALYGSGFVHNWASGDVTLTHAADTLTLSGDTLGSLVFAHSGTKAATSTTSASATFAGGVGVAGALWAGAPSVVNVTSTTNGVSVFTVNKDWVSSDATNLSATFSSYNDAGRFVIRRANGTQSSPTQILSGDTLGNINWRGYTSAAAFTVGVASINAVAVENFTGTANGTRLSFVTTATGATGQAQALGLFGDGGAVFGTSTTSPGANCVSISGTTASTSTTTGALVVSGGVGVGGALYATNRIQATSTAQALIYISGAGASGEGGVIQVTNGTLTHSFGTANGILGGTSSDFIFYAGTAGATHGKILIYTGGLATVVIDDSGTASTSASTGAFVIVGGLGLSGALCGGDKISSVHATAGVGYSTGAGGAVTQITSRTTGVTLNKVCGQITLVSAAGSATPASFTVTNSAVATTDTIILNQDSGTDKYILLVTAVGAGSFEITFYTTGGTTTEQPVINFSVIKAVAA